MTPSNRSQVLRWGTVDRPSTCVKTWRRFHGLPLGAGQKGLTFGRDVANPPMRWPSLSNEIGEYHAHTGLPLVPLTTPAYPWTTPTKRREKPRNREEAQAFGSRCVWTRLFLTQSPTARSPLVGYRLCSRSISASAEAAVIPVLPSTRNNDRLNGR